MKILFHSPEKHDERFHRVCRELTELGHELVPCDARSNFAAMEAPVLIVAQGSAGLETAQKALDADFYNIPPPKILCCGPARNAPGFAFRILETSNRMLVCAAANAAGALWTLERDQIAGETDMRAVKRIQGKLQEIGAALTAEKSLDRLLDLILQTSRSITGADAGALYLVEKTEEGESESRRLKLKFEQNESRRGALLPDHLPISREHLIGAVALDGKSVVADDVYALDPKMGRRFDLEIDRDKTCRTKSLLAVPLFNHKKEIIGVLKLTNRKRMRGARLESNDDVDKYAINFQPGQLALVEALTGQAAVSIENTELYESIESLILGVVEAYAHTAEVRTPLAAGLARRVMHQAITLASAVTMTDEGPLKRIAFDDAALRELQYAALLHGIGKIGVREELLTRSHKLSGHAMEAIRRRFDRWTVQRARGGTGDRTPADPREACRFLERINRSHSITEEESREVRNLGSLFVLEDGSRCLGEGECERLAILSGIFTEPEQMELDRGILFAKSLLESIPWLDDMRNVPDIVGSSRERYDGGGIPNGLAGDDIPIGARILAAVVAWNELTFMDRNEKPILDEDAARERMLDFAKSGRLDPNLTELYVGNRIYRVAEELEASEPEPAAAF